MTMPSIEFLTKLRGKLEKIKVEDLEYDEEYALEQGEEGAEEKTSKKK